MKGVEVFKLEPKDVVANLLRGRKYPADQRVSCEQFLLVLEFAATVTKIHNFNLYTHAKYYLYVKYLQQEVQL